jgi:hypothetical protein
MRQRGITLVETLVAMTVVAFALLAMARLHVGMAQAGDAARSRTEATQHARALLEELRGFSSDTLGDGSDLPGSPSHTAYLRRWVVEGHADDLVRPVRVAVEWADRRGELHEASLRSLLGRSDASDGGAAVVAPPPADRWWRPQGWHAGVPWHAARDADGRPTVAWPGREAGLLVFDANSGMVVEHCTGPAAPGRSGASTGCRRTSAYLLQGYVEGRDAGRLSVEIDRSDGSDAQADCVVTDAVDPETGQRLEGVRRYQCLVPAIDDDRDASTPPAWSGRVRLTGLAPRQRTVCRYTAHGNPTDDTREAEIYTRIDTTLDHQNFVILRTGDCPEGSVAHPSA